MRVSTGAAAAALGAAALLASAAGTATATHRADPGAGHGKTHVVRLSGAQEVPGPGDPDGSGRLTYRVSQGKLCYRLSVRGIAAPTAVHIHAGPAGSTGPHVVDLETPPHGGPYQGCVRAQRTQTPADASKVLTFWELEGIRLNPFLFYINVHNADFPDGAVRGRL